MTFGSFTVNVPQVGRGISVGGYPFDETSGNLALIVTMGSWPFDVVLDVVPSVEVGSAEV